MATLTKVFPCFFLSCKANARVKPAKTGHDLNVSKFLCCFMYFCVFLRIFLYCLFRIVCVLFVCICVLYYCHWVANKLQLNIYHIISYIILYLSTLSLPPVPVAARSKA
jgi:Na+/melibiose symporter-like transporter